MAQAAKYLSKCWFASFPRPTDWIFFVKTRLLVKHNAHNHTSQPRKALKSKDRSFLDRTFTSDSKTITGRPDHTWGDGGYGGGVGKIGLFSNTSDEKILCSANCKKWKFVHKTGRKMGLYEGEICLQVSLPERKESLFLVRSQKKKVCTGKKNIAAHHHTYRLVDPLPQSGQ